MKTIYHAYTEEVGEVEGMFDEQGVLLGMWSCNDATWRTEYFAGFMNMLGVKVEVAPAIMGAKLVAEAIRQWG